MREPVVGEGKAQDAMAFDEELCVVFPFLGERDTMIRFVCEESGTRELTHRLCDGGRVDSKVRCEIACLHHGAPLEDILEIYDLLWRKIQSVADLHIHLYGHS